MLEHYSVCTAVYCVFAPAQEAATDIRFLSYDPASNTSLVQCMVRGSAMYDDVYDVHHSSVCVCVYFLQPKTGRTHQIRLHLQWCGHPIANDPNYGDLLGPPALEGVAPADTGPATAVRAALLAIAVIRLHSRFSTFARFPYL